LGRRTEDNEERIPDEVWRALFPSELWNVREVILKGILQTGGRLLSMKNMEKRAPIDLQNLSNLIMDLLHELRTREPAIYRRAAEIMRKHQNWNQTAETLIGAKRSGNAPIQHGRRYLQLDVVILLLGFVGTFISLMFMAYYIPGQFGSWATFFTNTGNTQTWWGSILYYGTSGLGTILSFFSSLASVGSDVIMLILAVMFSILATFFALFHIICRKTKETVTDVSVFVSDMVKGVFTGVNGTIKHMNEHGGIQINAKGAYGLADFNVSTGGSSIGGSPAAIADRRIEPHSIHDAVFLTNEQNDTTERDRAIEGGRLKIAKITDEERDFCLKNFKKSYEQIVADYYCTDDEREYKWFQKNNPTIAMKVLREYNWRNEYGIDAHTQATVYAISDWHSAQA